MRATAAARAPVRRGEGVCRSATSTRQSSRQGSRVLASSTSQYLAVAAPPAPRCCALTQSRTTRSTPRATHRRADHRSAPKQPVATAPTPWNSEQIDVNIAAVLDRAEAQQAARHRGRAAKRWLESEREAQVQTDVASADVAQRRRTVANREAHDARAKHRQRGAGSITPAPAPSQMETPGAAASPPVAPVAPIPTGRLHQAPKVRYAIKTPSYKQSTSTVAGVHVQGLRQVGPPRRPVRSVPANGVEWS